MKKPTQDFPVPEMSRRTLLTLTAAAAAGAVLAPKAAAKERDWTGKKPVRYPDPDILVLDKRFAKIQDRQHPHPDALYTGMLWAEGPAWNGVGQYLVWSDIPNNVQIRWLEEDGHVSVFRNPSGYSNGNTFDCEGRQLSCEHGNRRVVRYEHDGKSVPCSPTSGRESPSTPPTTSWSTPTAASGSPTRATAFSANYEGTRASSQLKEAVYRIDKTGQDCEARPRRDVQAQRSLLFAGLQEALHR